MLSIKSIKSIATLAIIVLINIGQLKAGAEWPVTTLNNPSPGYINLSFGGGEPFFLIDNYGFNQYVDSSDIGKYSNNKLLSNGLWIVYNLKSYLLYNQDLVRVDSIPVPSGFNLDWHAVEVLSNGHYLLLCSEIVEMDLSKIVQDGKTDAKVINPVLVETDGTGTIYWLWKGLDHFNITDATSDILLSQLAIDFAHPNSIIEDNSGNIIVSFRHLDEITKINKSSGQIIWRMGGSSCKNNQFTFIGDNYDGFTGFSHQHSISILPNGNIIAFDNGNLKNHPYSRAVEYSLDQTNKTATKVWEYRSSPDLFVQAMGSVSRLPNGNTLINWGEFKLTELKTDKSIALEMLYPPGSIPFSAQKVISKMNAVSKDIAGIGDYSYSDGNNSTGVSIRVKTITGSGNSSIEKHYYAPPTGVYSDSSFTSILPYRWVFSQTGISSMNATLKINAGSLSGVSNPRKVAIYKRSQEAHGSFVELATTYNSNTNEIIADNISDFGEFTVVSKVLGIQYLSSPADTKLNVPVNGLVKWLKLSTARYYQVQISTSSNFTPLTVDQKLDNQLEFNYLGLLYNTIYYWRVRGINSADTSQWSDIYSFNTELSPPELLIPANNAYGPNTADSLKWKKVNGAENYWVQLSVSNDFTSTIIDNRRTNTLAQAFNQLANNTRYYWRVMAFRTTDSSKWSEVWNFTTALAKPVLRNPVNDTINIPIAGLVTWSPVKGAENYSIEISEYSTFSILKSKAIDWSDTTFPYTNLDYNKIYYWRVKAQRKTDASSWSDVFNFRTILPVPEMLSPVIAENLESILTKFIWKKNPPANSFAIQISLTKDFINPIIFKKDIDTSYFSTIELPANKKLYWRIMSFNDLLHSDWTDPWYFQTGNGIPISAPKLVSPLNNSENDISGRFTWNNDTRANKYKLQVSKTADFKSKITDTLIKSSPFYDYSNLEYGNKYYWRVKTYSLFDSSSWSETRLMTTPKLIAVKLLNPKNDQLQIPLNGKLEWEAVSGIESYMIQISDNPEFTVPIADSGNIKVPNYSFSGLKDYTTYYWRVRYIKDSDTSSWSKSWIFTTESAIVLNIPGLENPLPDQTSVPINGTLSWLAVPSATSYKISISTNQDFDEVAFRKTNLNDNKVNYYGLEYNQMYFWRVSASNDKSESQWSQVRKFLTELGMPNIVYPQDHSTGISLTGNIIWSEIPGSDTYLLQISTDSVFSNFVVNEEVSDPNYQYSLAENKIYYWRVKSKNYLNESQWTDISSFKTIDPNGVEEGNHIDLVSLFPNPAIDKLYLTNDKYKGSEYHVYDASGTLVSKEIFLNGVIDVSKLCSGTYFIKIGNELLYFVKN